MSASNRKFKNLLINPLIQFRLGGILAAILAVYSVVAVGYSFFSLGDFIELLVEMTDVPEEAREFLQDEVFSFMVGLLAILIIFFVFCLGIIIAESHKFLGAEYAIRRHIQENLANKKFDVPLVLRKNDYLQEIANEINDFSVKLSEE